MHVHAIAALCAAVMVAAAMLPAAAHAAGKGGSNDAAAERAAARADATVEQMMRADVNKDGVVTKDEVDRLDSRLGRRFQAADADGDGKLTLREFEKLRELSLGATGGASPGGAAVGGGAGGARR